MPPKKMLKLRSDGKLLSPKSRNPVTEPKSKGKRKFTESEVGQKSHVVVIRYGADKESRLSIAREIQDIFEGRRTSRQKKDTMRKSAPKPTKPPKPTHPFFLGKSVRATETECAAPNDTVEQQNPTEKHKTNLLSISSPSKASLLNRTNRHTWAGVAGSFQRAPRLPGALETIWPPKGMVHVCAPTEFANEKAECRNKCESPVHRRKLKDALIRVTESEDVLRRYRDLVRSFRPRKADSTDCTALRKPLRKVMTGLELQESVAKNILCSLSDVPSDADPFQDELASSQSQLVAKCAPVHGGLQRLYEKIPNSLTAFDKFECETLDWVHKYAPKQAEDILYLGPEVSILRDWLKSLAVSAVESRNCAKRIRESSVASRMGSMNLKKRRKKRAEALDGFVVSSDEEADQMNEIPTAGERELAAHSQSSLKRSVIRAGNLSQYQGDHERSNNAVVISGPCGSGKTAVVYAVAQELGFEIFEINAGSRRSGKDLLDKVGDMTRNHLVNRSHEADSKETVEDAENLLRLNHSLNQDIESGRQGTMQSFFQPEADTKKKPRGRPKKKEDAPKAKPSPMKAKVQKQSVILLEEVDVLFEEDKQFWATTLEMITRSKRPVIMTCTDESLLPVGELPIFAILRFTPPPESLATDYLLLLACNEGHLLSRDAVSSLYKIKQSDLRASIAELDLFCQMTIGDTQGGLGWFLIRSSSKESQNKKGEALRVVSEGSYPSGIGWLSQGQELYEADNLLERETELLSEVWHGWSLDMADFGDLINLDAFPVAPEPSNRGILANLQAIDDAYEALSAADICSPFGPRQDNATLLDTTQPELHEKSRANYAEGATLLQADPLVDQTGTSTSIALTLRALARRLLPLPQSLTPDSLACQLPASLCALHTCPPVTPQTLQTAFTPLKASIISTFSAPISSLTTDVAPYIRSITAFDLRLEEQRRQLEASLTNPKDGAKSVRTRTTRASRAALEGGAKATTRRERWFPNQLDFGLVSRTGGTGWMEAALRRMETETGYGDEARDVQRRGSAGSASGSEV